MLTSGYTIAISRDIDGLLILKKVIPWITKRTEFKIYFQLKKYPEMPINQIFLKISSKIA